jgi:chromosome segregation ATPase
MFKRIVAHVIGKFIGVTIGWLLLAGSAGYLIFGDAFFHRIASSVSSSVSDISMKIRAAAESSKVASLDSSLTKSGTAIRRLEQARDSLNTQLNALERRRSRIAGQLLDNRLRLRAALGNDPSAVASTDDGLPLECMDACRRSEQELKALDAALADGVRSADAVDAQLQLAVRSVDHESLNLEMQKTALAARDALARGQGVLDGLPKSAN